MTTTTIGDAVLHCGDCLKVLRTIPPAGIEREDEYMPIQVARITAASAQGRLAL